MNRTHAQCLKRYLPALLLSLLCLAAATHRADAAAPGRRLDVGKLVEAHTITCWHDGEMLDDLVLNARGKLTFLYIDAKLALAIQKSQTAGPEESPIDTVPPQLLQYSGMHGKRKGQAFFALLVDAWKPWTFDTGQITVGGYRLSEKDVYVDRGRGPQEGIVPGTNELGSDFVDYIGLYVPREHVKPGTTIQIGYGRDTVEWIVP